MSVKNNVKDVVIEEYCDGFAVTVNGKLFYFNQEESVAGLVEVFKEVGCSNVSYVEVY